MPGRIEGVALQGGDANRAHANVFIYVCDDLEHWDTVGNTYYVTTVMTDSRGRFVLDLCPPGRYVLVTSDHPVHCDESSAQAWVDVRSGKTTKTVIRGKLN